MEESVHAGRAVRRNRNQDSEAYIISEGKYCQSVIHKDYMITEEIDRDDSGLEKIHLKKKCSKRKSV